MNDLFNTGMASGSDGSLETETGKQSGSCIKRRMMSVLHSTKWRSFLKMLEHENAGCREELADIAAAAIKALTQLCTEG